MKTLATSLLMLVWSCYYAVDAITLKIANNVYSDETTIRFISGSTDGFNLSYDASKLFSPNRLVPSIYSMVDPIHQLCVKTYPPFTEGGVNTLIFIRNCVSATYIISCEEFGTIPASACIYMEDSQTGSLYNMRLGISYSFNLPADSVPTKPRFIIHFTVPSALTIMQPSCDVNKMGSISIFKPDADSWSYQLADAIGNIVKQDSSIDSTITISNLYPGNYQLYVFSKYGCTENFPIPLSSLAPPKLSFIQSADSVHLDSAYVKFTNTSENGLKYIWDFGDSKYDSISLNPVHVYTKTGVYTVKLFSENGTCSGWVEKTVKVLPNTSITTGIAEVQPGIDFKVCATPEGLLLTTAHFPGNEFYTATVYNSLGQLLYNEKIYDKETTHLIPGFTEQNGVLIVKLSTSQMQLSRKIIVLKSK